MKIIVGIVALLLAFLGIVALADSIGLKKWDARSCHPGSRSVRLGRSGPVVIT